MWRKINSHAHLLGRIIHSNILFVYLWMTCFQHFSFSNSRHYWVENFSLFIVSPRIPNSMICNCPSIFIQPFITSIVITTTNFQSIPFTMKGLVIRPSSSHFFYRQIPINFISSWIKIFWVEMKSLKIRMKSESSYGVLNLYLSHYLSLPLFYFS